MSTAAMRTAATTAGTPDPFAVMVEPTTLRIERLLPGPAERVWKYLTESDYRRQWLASGDMAMQPGAEFTLTWRNDTLTDPPGKRPDGFGAEHSQTSHVLEVEPLRKFSFTWGEKETGKVTFLLTPKGKEVLLTIVHERVTDRGVLLNVSAGWHAHLDMLEACAGGGEPTVAFWDHWKGLKAQYEKRLSA